MLYVPAIRITSFSLAVAALLSLSGCGTPPTKPATPATSDAAPVDPDQQREVEFQKLVQRLLEIEPALTGLLDQVAEKLEKPAQIAVEQELLIFLTGEPFAAALRNEAFFTAPTLLQQFTPETAASLKRAGLDRPMLNLVDDLASIATAIADAAARSEDGRALQHVFGLVHREVLPTLVEIRALVTEELLDNNEAAALTQRVEEQLRSINEQLASLQSRAQAVSSPTPVIVP